MKKFTEEEKRKWLETLESNRNEIFKKQAKERENIEKILKNRKSEKDKKREAKTTLRKLDNFIQDDARLLARKEFDYPIFMCEAEKVGITSTGDEDINELPIIFEEYKKFKENPDKYVSNEK